jgi:hypothetical protein
MAGVFNLFICLGKIFQREDHFRDPLGVDVARTMNDALTKSDRFVEMPSVTDGIDENVISSIECGGCFLTTPWL